MTNIKLLLKDIHGETKEEAIITLSKDDTLIVSYPKDMSLEVASKVFESVKKALESESKLLMLPEGIKLKVLSNSTQK